MRGSLFPLPKILKYLFIIRFWLNLIWVWKTFIKHHHYSLTTASSCTAHVFFRKTEDLLLLLLISEDSKNFFSCWNFFKVLFFSVKLEVLYIFKKKIFCDFKLFMHFEEKNYFHFLFPKTMSMLFWWDWKW